MRLNQNETEVRQARSEARLSRVAARSAFTLTELLVVIAIIAVLAALAVRAAIGALDEGKKTAILVELKNISGAVEDFKNKHGSYPPNAASPPSSEPAGTDATGKYVSTLHSNDMVLMFKRAFPRHKEPPALIAELTGNGTQLQAGMTGAESLVFWLGGFSEDAQYPISGVGGPSYVPATEGEDFSQRNSDYEFNTARLGPRNPDNTFAGRSVNYTDPRNGVMRRINLWTYNADGSDQPFFYFDTSRYRAMTEDNSGNFVKNYDPWFYAESVGVGERYAIKQLNASNINRVEFANQGKFQILHCGIDDLWGDFSVFSLQNGPLTYPAGPFLGEVADTLSNFTKGSLEDDQE